MKKCFMTKYCQIGLLLRSQHQKMLKVEVHNVKYSSSPAPSTTHQEKKKQETVVWLYILGCLNLCSLVKGSCQDCLMSSWQGSCSCVVKTSAVKCQSTSINPWSIFDQHSFNTLVDTQSRVDLFSINACEWSQHFYWSTTDLTGSSVNQDVNKVLVKCQPSIDQGVSQVLIEGVDWGYQWTLDRRCL